MPISTNKNLSTLTAKLLMHIQFNITHKTSKMLIVRPITKSINSIFVATKVKFIFLIQNKLKLNRRTLNNILVFFFFFLVPNNTNDYQNF